MQCGEIKAFVLMVVSVQEGGCDDEEMEKTENVNESVVCYVVAINKRLLFMLAKV